MTARPPPEPQRVRYNDWRQVAVPSAAAFRPSLPVSVIVSYYAQPAELARALAALECQTYPRKLVEVVVVDDGSPEPLVRPRSTSLNVKVVRQEDQGFRPAAARNAGARAAAHDVLVFMDGDTMPEPEFVAAHARWHHVVPDALTLGLHAHVPVGGVTPHMIRSHCGALEDLLRGRRVDLDVLRATLRTLKQTDELTAGTDDLFEIVTGGNLGVRREFSDLVGGFDETFTGRGGEDKEFGWRAFVRGAILIPVRAAFCWHQGSWEDGRPGRDRNRHSQQPKLANLVPHPGFREEVPGRSYAVPRFVVTIRGGKLRAERLLGAVGRVLSGSIHDLVVRLELSEGHPGRAWLNQSLEPDPRVRVAPAGPALAEFPASPFHISVPAWVDLHGDIVRRLHDGLGSAVAGWAELPGGAFAYITRAWALHRAQRTPWEASGFGDEVEIPAGRLVADPESARPAPASPPVPRSASPGAPPAGNPRANDPLGVKIAVRGARSEAVFRAAGQVAHDEADLVVVDTPAAAAHARAPVAVLAGAPPLLATPAFDPQRHNPVKWRYHHDGTVGALGPLDRLPAGISADRVVPGNDRMALKVLHHLEDTAAFHADPVARAGALVRLAAMGVVVHVADRDERLAPRVGDPLFALMTRDVRDLGAAQREMHSIRMRRTALREHSLRSRVRQLCAHAGIEPPPLPLVSVLLVTRRPHLLQHALAAVARQTYSRLELVLGLHGEGFADVDRYLEDCPVPATVVRVDPAQPLGTALNRAAAEAKGAFLAKMDDDEAYGREHVWDLVLAQEYAQADCVTKAAEYFFLARAGMTICRFREQTEVLHWAGGGSSMLVEREALARVGGFPGLHVGEDQHLMARITDGGGRVYRTHGAGYVLVRHGGGHTWDIGDQELLGQADALCFGWDPEQFCVDDMAASHLPPVAAPVDATRNLVCSLSYRPD